MTVGLLIDTVLRRIKAGWYGDNIGRFWRDLDPLKKAIARYGYEAERRGWDLDPDFICRELLTLIQQIRDTGADIRYLPQYLEGAVDRRIRIRAEEISAEAKATSTRITKALAKLRTVPDIRQPTATETLATLYRDLKTRPGRRKKTKPAPAQPSLL